MPEVLSVIVIAVAIATVLVYRFVRQKISDYIDKNRSRTQAEQYARMRRNTPPERSRAPVARPKATVNYAAILKQPTKLKQEPTALSPNYTRGSKLFRPEDFEPKDKPIRKTAAKKMYAEALRAARPNLSPKDVRYFTEGFGDSINVYLGTLEQELPTHILDDLQSELELLEIELYDEADDLTPEEIAVHNRTKQAIKNKRAEIKKFKDHLTFYTQKDLRYLLAAELNALIHKHPAPSYDVLIREAAQNHMAALHYTPSRP